MIVKGLIRISELKFNRLVLYLVKGPISAISIKTKDNFRINWFTLLPQEIYMLAHGQEILRVCY